MRASETRNSLNACFTLRFISTSQVLHINVFMTFPFITSYFGRVTLEIMIEARDLTIEQIVSLCIFILF